MTAGKRLINFTRYPIRTCRWLNECALCGKAITDGQKYRDGGYGRRAHIECADLSELEAAELERNK